MNLTNTLTLTPSIAIDIEAGNDIEHMINDVAIEATTETTKITNKMSVKKSLSDNPHFVLACHIIPRGDRINPARYRSTMSHVYSLTHSIIRPVKRHTSSSQC